jgi:subfamily B ATP-binding cassette protein HlyB/CyaB
MSVSLSLGLSKPVSEPTTGPASASPAPGLAGLSALCTIARFHQIAADPATLAHQLGLSGSDCLSTEDLLRAAQHLGLKAKLSRSSPERLALTPLPALALMRSDDDSLQVVVLAQSDGQRVLFQAGLGGGG